MKSRLYQNDTSGERAVSEIGRSTGYEMNEQDIARIADEIAKRVAVPRAVFEQKEAAHYLGVSEQILVALYQDGMIARVDFGASRLARYARAELDRYLSTSRRVA